ncbi:DinB family protein [Nonomuraea basaltis]|uniref:DinB family protein n=1 Tax=Nonomuraea basaltis TaxID=2495887 RepID=UPI00110C5E85|nr:DinB family protein [Nonomuraea basaltis]TMR90926.1 DinB family protein [Nonomuraea basaltis]
MPNLLPPLPDERSALLAFLEEQRHAIRAALRDLTLEQAVSAPSASDLSLAAILKHVTHVERRWIVAGVAGRPEGLWPVTDWDAELRIEREDTIESLLGDYANVADETTKVIDSVTDLGQACALEDCAHWSVRWVLLHLIEETARHAGHTDIIRESLDGATALDRR